MNIKIEDFLRKITLPKRYFNEKFDICEKFKYETDKYLNLLKLINGNEFEKDKAEIIGKKLKDAIGDIQKNIDSIINIFTYHENANPKAAQEEIDMMMERIKNDIFIASIDDRVKIYSKGKAIFTQIRLTPGRQFYRVRAVSEKKLNIQNNPDELFHIPLSKKALVNNERFSLAGFPSLYLSSMLPLAWQECGYPKKYYYSEYQYEKLSSSMSERNIKNELKFLALYSPDEICDWGTAEKYSHFEEWLEVIIRYLRQYPLVLACAFVNQSGKATYKQEYIIPQMLMQWIQRNSHVVQGISYFTCTDLTMFNNKWCAYNLVIPATGPYDEKKYSKVLKDAFGWSRPKYYEVPLVDCAHNESDRERLYIFIEKIREDLRSIYFPEKYLNYLLEVLNLSCCLYNILETADTIDMQLALHVMELIRKSYYQLSMKVDAIIKEVDEKKDSLLELEKKDFNQANTEFQNIIQEFMSENKSINGVKFIINKYSETIWNSFNSASRITVLYTDKDNLKNEIIWLHENHFLYYLRKLKSDDKTVEYIKNICKETETDLEQLWNEPVAGDAWMKENMEKIKTPIFVRTNDNSKYSMDDVKMYDCIQIEFNEKELKEKLF